nr:sulfatase-like hydrolase/transferase [Gemmatimonadales bacterium]
FLQSQGYRIVFFPSLWWASTHRNPHADVTFNPWHGFNLGHALSRSDLRRTLRKKTLFEFTNVGSFANDDDYIERAFAGLAQVPGSGAGRPTFTFAHFLAPHGPYVFDADCRTTVNVPTGSPPVKDRSAAYIGMIRCIDRMVLTTVTEILRKSTVPPIILLQSDHGSKTLDFDGEPSPDKVSDAQARERFGAFGAYYLPAGGDSLFRDSVTVVNVLPKVFNFYFHTELPLSPDTHYMSVTGLGKRRIMDDRALASGQRMGAKPGKLR